ASMELFPRPARCVARDWILPHPGDDLLQDGFALDNIRDFGWKHERPLHNEIDLGAFGNSARPPDHEGTVAIDRSKFQSHEAHSKVRQLDETSMKTAYSL